MNILQIPTCPIRLAKRKAIKDGTTAFRLRAKPIKRPKQNETPR